MICPKCGFDTPDPATDCGRCGVVFAKLAPEWASAPPPPPPPPPSPSSTARARLDPRAEVSTDVAVAPRSAPADPVPTPFVPRPTPPSREVALPAGAWRTLAWGGGIGVLAFSIPFVRFVLSWLETLVHELGHAAVSWAFGRPALPAFDFVQGGGYTHWAARNAGLVTLVLVVFSVAGWRARHHRRYLGVVVGLALLWIGFFSSGWDEMLILAAGRGFELLFAGIFLYRGLTGAAVRVAGERFLYAMLGSFLWIGDLVFFSKIIANAGFREEYETQGKLGWHMMDMSRVADEFFGVPITVVAVGFLVLTLATPLAVWLLARHRETLGERMTAWLAG